MGANHRQAEIETLNQQAQQLARTVDWKQAIALYQQSLEKQPVQAEIWYQLGSLYYQKQHFADAAHMLNQTIKIIPRHDQALMLLGQSLFQQGHVEQALKLYHMIQSWFPNRADIAERIASLMLASGQTSEASQFCDEALKHFPNRPELLRVWCSTATPDMSHPRINRMKATCDDEQASHDARRQYAFILAKLFAHHNDDELAFTYLQLGNQLRFSGDLRTAEQRSASLDRYIDSIIEQFPTDNPIPSITTRNNTITPIFIIGMPRSGTSLVEQILATHSQIVGAGELSAIPTIAKQGLNRHTQEAYPAGATLLNEEAAKQLADDYMDQLECYGHNQKQVSHITDKLPQNFLFLGLIKQLLPHAIIIHCQRDAMDNCLSIYEQDFTGHHDYAYDQQTIGHYYNRYRDLMAHWHRLWPDWIHTIQYEALVEDTETQARQLVDLCGLKWEPELLAFHKTKRATRTASASQVTQPIYRSAIQKWKRYEEQLQPLYDMLHPA